MAVFEMNGNGGGGTLTHIADVTSIRNTPYTFPSKGTYLVMGAYEATTSSAMPKYADLSTSGCTVDSGDCYVTTNNPATNIYIGLITARVEVTSDNATLGCSTATNTQAWQIYKLA
jgi:hypothetical protein